MDTLEETLRKLVEYAQEELSIVRKRAEQRTPRSSHSHDFDRMADLADKVDHHAHELRRLHDGEFREGWRTTSVDD